MSAVGQGSPPGDDPGEEPVSIGVAGAPATEGSPPRVLVLAVDLAWASRLAAQLRSAGADPETVHDAGELAAHLAAGGIGAVVIDLAARAYDGIAALGTAAATGLPVLAIGQHDDVDLRRRALAAGASWVHSYRTMFERGPQIFAAWLAAGRGDLLPPPMEPEP